jgi:hypothetical protein
MSIGHWRVMGSVGGWGSDMGKFVKDRRKWEEGMI